jgi:CheY-like chemotaxis protein
MWTAEDQRLARAISADDEPRTLGSGRAEGERRTILVVEDEVDMRQLLDVALTRQGYAVLAARDGLEGLGLIESARPAVDAVILDLSMPGLSGEEVLEALRHTAPALPVIISSGSEVSPARLAGARAFLKKPYSLALLRQTVASVLIERGGALPLPARAPHATPNASAGRRPY